MSMRRDCAARWRATVLAAGLVPCALGLEGAHPRAGVLAQTAAAVTGGAPRVGCFRGRPLPTCKTFWIVEMQGETPFAQTTREITYQADQSFEARSFEEQLEWNLGHVVNARPRLAVGGVLTLGTGGEDILNGLKLRARRWLNESVSVELEGGPRRWGGYPSSSYGITADARLNIRDQGAFYLRWDGLRMPRYEDTSGYLDPGGFQQAVSVGGGLGSVPALVGSGALGLGVLIYLAAYLAAEGG